MRILISRSFLLSLILSLVAQTAHAGKFEDGNAATNKGDDKAALQDYIAAGTPSGTSAGDPTAQLYVAAIYASGAKGVPKDCPLAIIWMKKAVNQGDAQAEWAAGYAYAFGLCVAKDPVQSFDWTEKSADQGYPGGELEIAADYVGGTGVPKNLPKAIYWGEKLATVDPKMASGWSHMFGDAYATGVPGLPKNPARAAFWYAMTDFQTPNEIIYLVNFYCTGSGDPVEEKNCEIWLVKLANLGNPADQYELALEYTNSDAGAYTIGSGDVPHNEAKSAYWFRKSADQGYADSQIRVGDEYAHGDQVPQNYAAALQWYEKALQWYVIKPAASDAGDRDDDEITKQDLYIAIAQIYNDGGFGVSQDYEKSVHWYIKSAQAGDVYTAPAVLGDDYRHGNGVKQDFVKSASWFRKGAEGGNEYSQDMLGHDYECKIACNTDPLRGDFRVQFRPL